MFKKMIVVFLLIAGISNCNFLMANSLYADTITPVNSFKAHQGGAFSISFSPSGTAMVSCGLDGLVKVWDTKSWKLVKTLKGHTGETTGAVFSKDEKYIISAGYDGQVIIWEMKTGKPFKTITPGSWATSLGVNKTGQLAVGMQDGKVYIVEIPSGKIISSFDCGYGVNSLSFSADQKTLVTGGPVVSWDWQTGKKIKSFKLPGGVSAVACSFSGSQVVSSHARGTAYISDINTGDIIFSCQNIIKSYVSAPVGSVIADIKLPVTAAAFSNDGNYLALGYYEDKIIIINRGTGTTYRVFAGLTGLTNSLAFSPDSKLLVSCGSDGTLTTWNL